MGHETTQASALCRESHALDNMSLQSAKARSLMEAPHKAPGKPRQDLHHEQPGLLLTCLSTVETDKRAARRKAWEASSSPWQEWRRLRRLALSSLSQSRLHSRACSPRLLPSSTF